MIERSEITCRRYFDSLGPIVVTLVPLGQKGKFAQLMDGPYEGARFVGITTLEDFEKKLLEWEERQKTEISQRELN